VDRDLARPRRPSDLRPSTDRHVGVSRIDERAVPTAAEGIAEGQLEGERRDHALHQALRTGGGRRIRSCARRGVIHLQPWRAR